MSSVQSVVVSLSGYAADATVEAEAIGRTRLSIRINGLVAFVHNQRVIREMRRTVEDACRLAQVQKLPARATPTFTGACDALSLVHFGQSISSQVFFNARFKNRPHIRIETPPVTWVVRDGIALDQFSDVWTAAGALGTHLPGAVQAHDPRDVKAFQSWARRHGITVRTFESEAILALANGENVPWLRLLPGTRANELRHLARVYTLHRATEDSRKSEQENHAT